MTRTSKLWTREELILAINLYCKTPYGKIHMRNPEIIRFAQLIGRTPSSIVFKLSSFANIDPALPRKGYANVSKLDREVWAEFSADWDRMVFESEQRLAALTDKSLEEVAREEADIPLPEEDIPLPEGRTCEAVVRQRVNQGFPAGGGHTIHLFLDKPPPKL